MTTTADHDATGPLGRRQTLVVFGGVMLAMLLGALDQTVVATALPTIVGDLGGLSHLSWVVTAYVLAATPLWGKIGDLYGRKLLFQISIAVFLAGSVLSGISQNMGELIAFRAFQGLGAGGLTPEAGRRFPGQRRGRGVPREPCAGGEGRSLASGLLARKPDRRCAVVPEPLTPRLSESTRLRPQPSITDHKEGTHVRQSKRHPGRRHQKKPRDPVSRSGSD